MDGWIKLHRQLLEKPIWKQSTPEQKVILITLLCMANHEPNEWEWECKKFVVRKGQFVTSLESIANESGKGITRQNVRTALKRFEKLEFLTNESTKTGRLITIVNWEIYQSYNEESNKETNKDLTNTQQRPNEDLTSNKNDKNDKNDKNVRNNNNISAKTKRFTPPTLEEVKVYCAERNNNVDAERFISYYESNGWKVGRNNMKDWKASVRTWERNNIGGGNGGQHERTDGKNKPELGDYY